MDINEQIDFQIEQKLVRIGHLKDEILGLEMSILELNEIKLGK